MCVGSFWSFLWAFAQGSCFHASIIKWNNFNNRHHTFQMIKPLGLVFMMDRGFLPDYMKIIDLNYLRFYRPHSYLRKGY